MVQIIPAVERKPSFGARLSQGLGSTLEKTSENALQKQMLEAQAMQKQKLMQQEYGLKGDLEARKQKEKYSALIEAINGAQNNRQDKGFADQISGEKPAENQNNGQPSQFESGNKPPHDPQEIAELALIHAPTANLLQRQNEDWQRNREHKEQFEEQKRKTTPEYVRQETLAKEQAKEDSKYYADLSEKRSKQILKKESLARLKALGKKNVTGKVWESILDRMGLTQKTSEGYREYTAEQKNQFTDFKAIAGSQLSAREFFTLASAYPNSNFSPEANEAIIRNLEDVHDTLDKEYEIATKLRKENKGKPPEYVQERVNEELEKYTSKKIQDVKDNIKKVMNAQYGIQPGYTLMFDENNEPLSVPDDKVSQLLDDGLADLP